MRGVGGAPFRPAPASITADSTGMADVVPKIQCLPKGDISIPPPSGCSVGNNCMHPGEVNTPALQNTKTASSENVSISVPLCLMGTISYSKTMVFCVDESMEMVSTKIKDNFGISRGTKLRMASRGLGIAPGTLGEVLRIRDGDAVMNVLTEDWTPTHVKATHALPS